MSSQSSQQPYQQSVASAIAALGTDAQRGLSEAEARARLERDGRNELAAEAPVPAWRKFLAQFGDVLVILLLIARQFPPRYGWSSASRRCPTKR
jgi:P-type Ca2+ transporter type 2C